MHHDLIRRQEIGGALGPFDYGNAFGERMIKSKLMQFLGRLQSIEIEMRDIEPAGAVGLHKGERRAWDLKIAAA